MLRRDVARLTIVFGLSLTIVLISHVAYAVRTGAFEGIILLNVLFSAPFIGLLIAGGYWLHRHDLGAGERIGLWMGGGALAVGGIFLILAFVILESPHHRVGAIIWGLSAGGGSGMLVGIFEAQALSSAREAERERLRLEKIRRENERLERFARIVSHDLRNPLNVAMGRLKMAREERDSDDLAATARALERLDVILTETLTLAREGQLITATKETDLEDLARQAWTNVDTGDAVLQVEGTAQLDCDPNRMEQVFENLFGNAVEHVGFDATVWVGPLPDGSGFYVEDDGDGIPVENRDAIFAPGETTKPDGTGFGLAIVESILSAHDANVEVIEGRDGGARFECTFPRRATTEPASKLSEPTPLP